MTDKGDKCFRRKLMVGFKIVNNKYMSTLCKGVPYHKNEREALVQDCNLLHC